MLTTQSRPGWRTRTTGCRVEIESALRRPKIVIPVPRRRDHPRVDQLPGELAQLGLRQAVEITASGFANQVETLITTLKKISRAALREVTSVAVTVDRIFCNRRLSHNRLLSGNRRVSGSGDHADAPIAFIDYPVLPEDLQWSGPVAGNVVVERFLVGEVMVGIGDPLVMLRSESGPVTLWSTYIGQVEAPISTGPAASPGSSVAHVAVSGWLFRVNFRMPFDTGVMIASGTPPRKLDPTGTASGCW